MNSALVMRELRAFLSRSLGLMLEEILRSKTGKEIAQARALDLYLASGHLLRASSTFVGTLSDFVQYRSILAVTEGSLGERKLLESTQFLAAAIDDFNTSVAAINPHLETQRPDGEYRFAARTAAIGGTAKCLVEAVLDKMATLDRHKVVLAEARESHNVLRGSIADLRKLIKEMFKIEKLA